MPRKAKRNDFVSVKPRKTAHGVVYQARYKTPVEMIPRYPGARKEQYKTFADETEAYGWLAAEKRKIAAGVWEPPKAVAVRAAAKGVKFRDYATSWIENRRKPNGEALESSTKIKYTEKLENHLLKPFGDKTVAAIKPDDVQKWWDSYGANPPQVRSDAYTMLKSIMHTAETEPINEQGDTLIDRSPCRLRGTTVRKKHKTVTAELHEIKTVYEAMPERLALSIYLGGVMSLRIGEVLALRRGDVDLTKNVLHVAGSVKPAMKDGKQVIVRGKTKTANSDRYIDIPEALRPIFAEHLRYHTGRGKAALLFEAKKSGVMRENVFSYYWRQARATVPRLREGEMKFHDLRHTALQHLVENGATLNMVMAVAGHSDIKVAGKYQDGVTKSFSQQITGRISQQLEEVINSSASAATLETDTGNSMPASATIQGQTVNDETRALAGTLEGMALTVRIQVLKNLDAAKRSQVLSCFSPDVQVETMTQLLSEVA